MNVVNGGLFALKAGLLNGLGFVDLADMSDRLYFVKKVVIFMKANLFVTQV